MKKILTLVALVIGLVTSGQVKQTYPQYGGKWKRHQVDSAIKIPMLSVGVRDLNAGLDTAQLMYQKTDSSLRVYTGSQWLTIGGSSGSVTSISQGYGILNSPNPIIATGSVTLDSATIRAWLNGHYWRDDGNASTTPGTNFLGTTDGQALQFRTNGALRLSLPATALQPGSSSDSILVKDGSGVIKTRAQSAVIGVNIYNSDGTLNGDRNIDADGNTFNLTGLNELNLLHGAAGLTGIHSQVGEVDLLATNLINTSETSNINVYSDQILIAPYQGELYIDSLNYTLNTTRKKILVRDTLTGDIYNIDPSLLSTVATAVPISGLTAATGTNSINNLNHSQVWNWSTLDDAAGALSIGSNSTLSASSTQTLLQVDLSGANVNSGQRTVSTRILNRHSGSTSTNVAAEFSASGGTINNAINIAAGAITLNSSAGISGQVLTSAGANTLPTWATPSVGGTPAGNFGNLQIGRNGAFATPASDSLDFESATGLQVKGNIGSTATINAGGGDIQLGGVLRISDNTIAGMTTISSADNGTAFFRSGNNGLVRYYNGSGSQYFSQQTDNDGYSYFNLSANGGKAYQFNAFAEDEDFVMRGDNVNDLFFVDGGLDRVGIGTATPSTILDVVGVTSTDGLNLDRTITAAGTTGNQTINKMAGTVNIAAAGTTVTVTNSLVDASSIIFCVIRTNDGTATIKNVVPGAGSFVINLGAAATAEISIGFVVTN